MSWRRRELSLPSPPGGSSLAVRLRAVDRVDVGLGAVLLLACAFFLWTAGSAVPLSLHGGLGDRYNLLATALLHFHLSVGPAPLAFAHLSYPYDPHLYGSMVEGVNDATSVNDDILYHGHLYFLWGPAPALVLLVPLHLLGLEPSASVTVAFYGTLGTGFALATLRVILRRIGDTPLWMCTLAGLALAFTSAVPFLLRTPATSEDTLAGGLCFTMAGIWLAASTLANRQASIPRLACASLCFGLAAGSRPTLGLTALVLVPVYMSLRATRPRRTLLMALSAPVGTCFALLLAYNQARFHQPLEFGLHYQLTGYDSGTAPLGRLSYIPSGARSFALTSPLLGPVFPFISIKLPQGSFPAGLVPSEITGGLLPMAPITAFALALPWIWRRRPKLLGDLAGPLLILAGAGVTIALLAAYETFATTERYEVDFLSLFMLAGLSSWLALSRVLHGHLQRLWRIVGGLLAAWGCIAGVAISFFGYGKSLAVTHPNTWKALEDLSSPISAAIANVVGHPVLAGISALNLTQVPSRDAAGHRVQITVFSLSSVERAELTIVSPDARTVALVASVRLSAGGRYALRIDGSGNAGRSYPLPQVGGVVHIPVRLGWGLNRLALTPVVTSARNLPATAQVVLVRGLSLQSD
jgi:hypothetical protein